MRDPDLPRRLERHAAERFVGEPTAGMCRAAAIELRRLDAEVRRLTDGIREHRLDALCNGPMFAHERITALWALLEEPTNAPSVPARTSGSYQASTGKVVGPVERPTDDPEVQL